MYCPSRMENWDGEEIEKETSGDEAGGKSVMAETLCNLLIFLGGGWIFIPANQKVRVRTYWRNCGEISIKSDLFVRIASGYSKGAIVSRNLLRPPGMW